MIQLMYNVVADAWIQKIFPAGVRISISQNHDIPNLCVCVWGGGGVVYLQLQEKTKPRKKIFPKS